MTSLTLALKAEAHALGFDHCRITPVAEAPHSDFFLLWLQQGRAGEMGYLLRHAEKRRHPQRLVDEDLPPPRSLIVLAVNHYQFDLPQSVRNDPSRGLIASYAWGDDYHTVIRPQLFELDQFLRRQSGRTTQGKALVDTGPVLERDWAQQAGIGFTGKNCCTIHPTDGSWLLLATLLVPEALDYDWPPLTIQSANTPSQTVVAGLPPAAVYGSWQFDTDEPGRARIGTCGRCTRCLDACPTDAFVGPYHLDPQRCISYWTIEARGAIPRELRSYFGNRIFGCDICQEVCPWNQRLPTRTPLLAGLAAQAEPPPILIGWMRQPFASASAIHRSCAQNDGGCCAMSVSHWATGPTGRRSRRWNRHWRMTKRRAAPMPPGRWGRCSAGMTTHGQKWRSRPHWPAKLKRGCESSLSRH
ncbi:MAG TPA: DUF1730 domain-containing protein [Caldilineaceae bacterium]|nr:DUF1730 domain-containing protein [Caldilineaceae bacterium]